MKYRRCMSAQLVSRPVTTSISCRGTCRKSIDFLICLSLSAVLVACGGSSNSSTESITATGGTAQSAEIDAQFAAQLQATVTSGGSPASGVTVTFTGPATGASLVFAGAAYTMTATTNGNGVATSYGFAANGTAGTFTVTASVAGVPTPASFTLTNTSATPASISATGGTPQSAQTGAPFAPLTAQVLDANSNPLAGATVTFAAPGSGASGTFANNAASESDTTDGNGVATSSITADATVGSYTVTASVSGVTTPASFSLTNTAAVETITATAGTGQGATPNSQFVTKLQATVMLGLKPLSGATVTFTAPASGASGAFATTPPSTTATATTDAIGVATAPAFTANGTIGSYSVSASTAGVSAPATFSLSNIVPLALTPGNYVFSMNGGDFDTESYSVAGVIQVGSNGAITGGELDTAFAAETISSIGSSYTTSADGNVIFTLATQNKVTGLSGVLILDATLVSSSRALLTEFDSSARANGSLELQTTSLVTPSGRYAFYVFGQDSRRIAAIGGVINVDSAGGISGAGSAFDINDANLLGNGVYTGQLFAPSTVSAPDSFGRVQFTLNGAAGNTSGVSQITLAGYMVDSQHIKLVEVAGGLSGVTGGEALGQTGPLTNSSVSGSSYVFGLGGVDNSGPLQVAGVLTLTATPGSNTAGTVSGTLNYSDPLAQNAQGGTAFTGTYTFDTVDPGRVTLSNLTDSAGDFNYSLQLYLTGEGHALVISIDGGDCFAGVGFLQQTAPFTAASLKGSYALNIAQGTTNNHYAGYGVGPVTADGVSAFAGFVDINGTAPVPDVTLSGSFNANANGIFTGAITGIDLGSTTTIDHFTYYLVDSTKGFAIENDAKASQVNLGYFELQQ
jgi:hypothetical protein